MIYKMLSFVSSVVVMSCCLMGCQTNNQAKARLTSDKPIGITSGVRLTSYRASEGLVQEPNPTQATSTAQKSLQQNDQPQSKKLSKDEESAVVARPITKTLYTAPSSASALAIASAALGSTQNMTNDGREASENIGISMNFRQALQPSVSIGDGGSVGKRGLQRGSPLTGANNLNIFTPRSNGITNRCQELITAGFFADITGCRNHFSR